MDGLRALKTDESRLFPAPCLIERIEGVVPREQEAELIDRIIYAGKNPVVVHAAGGVGKTVFSTRIHMGLPKGSVCVLYDCFGNGQYRSPSGYRHRHKVALVQIANELARRGFCHPLIPTTNADSSAYLTAFLHRLDQTFNSMRAENANALLCIVVDAADNAQIAAEEINEPGRLSVTCYVNKSPRAFAWSRFAEHIGKFCWTHRPMRCDLSCDPSVEKKLRHTSTTVFPMLLNRMSMNFIG